MKYHLILSLMTLALIGPIVAQDESVPEGTIYGHVYDANTKQPLSGAFYYCQEISAKDATDKNGYYAIKAGLSPLKKYNLECIKYGYESVKMTITTDENGKAEANFYLEPSILEGPAPPGIISCCGNNCQRESICDETQNVTPTSDHSVCTSPSECKTGYCAPPNPGIGITTNVCCFKGDCGYWSAGSSGCIPPGQTLSISGNIYACGSGGYWTLTSGIPGQNCSTAPLYKCTSMGMLQRLYTLGTTCNYLDIQNCGSLANCDAMSGVCHLKVYQNPAVQQ